VKKFVMRSWVVLLCDLALVVVAVFSSRVAVDTGVRVGLLLGVCEMHLVIICLDRPSSTYCAQAKRT
jgi:hypothetical protein